MQSLKLSDLKDIIFILGSIYLCIMNIGVIGLGLMGSQIASRLISTGHVVSVYNRDATKTKPFEKVDVRIANSPKELAQNSDFII
ncbi:MAG TPA: NAD(P)-binding domain-containing protein, partial [Nitrososphaeraceae archaeon]|nr:NAD(P)-binding domain-containing protein [Nitrososphaeraceae archaeon]